MGLVRGGNAVGAGALGREPSAHPTYLCLQDLLKPSRVQPPPLMISCCWTHPTCSSMAQITLSSRCLVLAQGYLASPVADVQPRSCFSNRERLLADER